MLALVLLMPLSKLCLPLMLVLVLVLVLLSLLLLLQVATHPLPDVAPEFPREVLPVSRAQGQVSKEHPVQWMKELKVLQADLQSQVFPASTQACFKQEQSFEKDVSRQYVVKPGVTIREIREISDMNLQVRETRRQRNAVQGA